MDIAILETYDGGDAQLRGNDVALVYGIENELYLAMYGGNPEQSTTTKIPEQSFDWWGNKLLFFSDPTLWFNSLTERSFNEIPLTSLGRVQIENAMKSDLAYLKKKGAVIEVSVTIVATDRIDIVIKVTIGLNMSITVINYRKNDDGDFFIADFNNDWY